MRANSASNHIDPATQATLTQRIERKAPAFANTLVAPTANMVAKPLRPSDYDRFPPKTKPAAEISYDSCLDGPLEGPSVDRIATPILKGPLPPVGQPENSMAIDPTLFSVPAPVQGSVQTKRTETPLDCEKPPAFSLVSPPASSHDDMGHSPGGPEATYTTSPFPSRQGSQQPNEHLQRYTPESGTIRRASHSSYEDGSSEKETLTTADKAYSPAQKKDRTNSVAHTDDESLRLIKELQAQDLGLRRRGRS